MKSKRVVWSLVGAVIVWASLSGAPGQALAQETQAEEQRIVEPSEAQMALNDDGVRAMIEGDYAAAVSLLERSTRLGSVNVTYLNLGRAYQKLGNCAKARDALEKAKTAPAVADPPPAEVRMVAGQYLAELDASCEDEASDQSDTPNEDVEDVEDVEVVDRSDSPNILGWGATLSGVGLIGGGIAMHLAAESKRAEVTDQQGIVTGVTQREAAEIEKSADTYDTIGLAMGIGGGVVAALGTYLLLTDDAGSESGPGGGASVWIGGDEAGISWTRHF